MVERRESLIMIPQAGGCAHGCALGAFPPPVRRDYSFLLIPESIWMRPCRIWSVFSLRPLRPARIW